MYPDMRYPIELETQVLFIVINQDIKVRASPQKKARVIYIPKVRVAFYKDLLTLVTLVEFILVAGSFLVFNYGILIYGNTKHVLIY